MLQVLGTVQLGTLKPTPCPVAFAINGELSVYASGPLFLLSVPLPGLGAAGTTPGAGAIILAADFLFAAACPLNARRAERAKKQNAKKRRGKEDFM